MRLALIGTMLALSGCGTGSGALDVEVLSRVRSLLTPTETQDLRLTLTQDALAGIDGAALLLELPKRGAQAVAGQVGTRAGHQTWVTQDGITVSFRNGALSTTRGLGNDLMAADLDEVVSALKGHREQALRLHQYLDGEDQTVTRAFICDYTTHGTQTLQTLFHGTPARHITETCVSTDLQFENQYWFGPRGILRKSRQWVGPENGPLLVERIKD